MKFSVDLPQPVAGDVSVNLRRADIGVAEQFLDHAQVRAVFQQMRREAVPQHMRCHIPLHTGAPDAILDVQPERHRCEGRAALREENISR